MNTFDDQHPRGHPTGRTRFASRPSRLPELSLGAPLLAGAAVPLISPEALTHVGLLDPTRKKSVSQEGQGLSISEHPDEWRGIAGLTGNVWEFEKDDGRFLDYRQLSAPQLTAITTFGLERGYVRQVPGFTLSYVEDCEDVSLPYFSQAEADDEAVYVAENFGPPTITEVTYLVATETFPDATVEEGQLDPEQILAAVWVSEEAPELDGVWWQDELDERRWAPRGVIIPGRISAWVSAARRRV